MAHPSYRNPTLQEALCEFQLASAWSPGKPAPLIERLRERYPDFETITQQGVAVAIGPDGALIPSPVQPRLKLKFSKSGGAPFILQFQTGVFSIHVLRPYPGWSAFRTELLRVWPVVVEVMQPAAVRRIGMRYKAQDSA